MSSFPVNELTEIRRRRRVPSPNRLTRQFPPLWRGGSRWLGRNSLLLLAAAGDRQQERSLAAVGNSLGARRLARGRLLRRRRRILREAALRGLHQIDHLGWFGDLTRRSLQPFGLGLDQLAQCVLVTVAECLRFRTRPHGARCQGRPRHSVWRRIPPGGLHRRTGRRTSPGRRRQTDSTGYPLCMGGDRAAGDTPGRTALCYAAELGSPEMVRLVLDVRRPGQPRPAPGELCQERHRRCSPVRQNRRDAEITCSQPSSTQPASWVLPLLPLPHVRERVPTPGLHSGGGG
jgi:hypothetical protein